MQLRLQPNAEDRETPSAATEVAATLSCGAKECSFGFSRTRTAQGHPPPRRGDVARGWTKRLGAQKDSSREMTQSPVLPKIFHSPSKAGPVLPATERLKSSTTFPSGARRKARTLAKFRLKCSMAAWLPGSTGSLRITPPREVRGSAASSADSHPGHGGGASPCRRSRPP